MDKQKKYVEEHDYFSSQLYNESVAEAMKAESYEWMDIVFVDFGEIQGDCLLRKSRPAIVLSDTQYNENSPVMTVAPMTRSLKGLDSNYHIFIDKSDCKDELYTSGMCMLEHSRAVDRRQVKYKMSHVYDEHLRQKIVRALAQHLHLVADNEGK